jgi:nucleoside 2-deoxyribosyltransferase
MPHDVSPRGRRPRIYLAGPDVFFRESEAVFRQLMTACERLGLVGVPPSDGGLSAGFVGSDDVLAQRIYEGNVALIRDADGVIANLASFRGHEPDSGTAFEVGFAAALGKPVVAYNVPEPTYAQRVSSAVACERDASGVLRECASGTMVEGLGQRLNLMLTRSAHIAASAEEALALLAEKLRARAHTE